MLCRANVCQSLSGVWSSFFMHFFLSFVLSFFLFSFLSFVRPFSISLRIKCGCNGSLRSTSTTCYLVSFSEGLRPLRAMPPYEGAWIVDLPLFGSGTPATVAGRFVCSVKQAYVKALHPDGCESSPKSMFWQPSRPLRFSMRRPVDRVIVVHFEESFERSSKVSSERVELFFESKIIKKRNV